MGGNPLNILALDSSGLVASLALVQEEKIIGEYTINYKQTHSQTLLPMLDSLVKQLGIDLSTIDAIAVSGGPGSFTGLRIGAATAKGLGLALDIPIINIPTAEAMAYQIWNTTGYICPIMDARRAQVYTGIYEYTTAQDFNIVKEQMAVPMMELIHLLNESNKPVTFLGDGVPVHQQLISEQLTVPYTFAPTFASRQRAATVGVRAIEYFKKGKIEHPREHQPDYLRASQAERERLEREGADKTQVTVEEKSIDSESSSSHA